MRPQGLKAKIFLDSGDPAETKAALALLGFLDGQTTNPTLVAKNPYARERFEKGDKFTEDEILDFYKQVVIDISDLIPDGSVSIEVHADQTTTAEQMLAQGREMFRWIPNAHIKYPTTMAGLTAAEQSVHDGLRVNMTLCFSQEQ
ncbi:MAG TPA: transaldolase family protein, partial [Verrucomicrobiae bacterium]|nr:transaldolase family protein [Verrucomicrobiae bacterium]